MSALGSLDKSSLATATTTTPCPPWILVAAIFFTIIGLSMKEQWSDMLRACAALSLSSQNTTGLIKIDCSLMKGVEGESRNFNILSNIFRLIMIGADIWR